MDYELTVSPAYGRDYQSMEAVKHDWFAGKDFIIETAVSPYAGRYCSIRDVKHFPGEHVKIRFAKLTEQCFFNIKTGEFTSVQH